MPGCLPGVLPAMLPSRYSIGSAVMSGEDTSENPASSVWSINTLYKHRMQLLRINRPDHISEGTGIWYPVFQLNVLPQPLFLAFSEHFRSFPLAIAAFSAFVSPLFTHSITLHPPPAPLFPCTPPSNGI